MEPLDNDIIMDESLDSPEVQALKVELRKHQKTLRNFKFFIFFWAGLSLLPSLGDIATKHSVSYDVVFPILYLASGLIFFKQRVVGVALALVTYWTESFMRGVSSYGWIFFVLISVIFSLHLKAAIEITKIESKLSELGIKP